jgi:hypothetical protein
MSTAPFGRFIRLFSSIAAEKFTDTLGLFDLCWNSVVV